MKKIFGIIALLAICTMNINIVFGQQSDGGTNDTVVPRNNDPMVVNQTNNNNEVPQGGTEPAPTPGGTEVVVNNTNGANNTNNNGTYNNRSSPTGGTDTTSPTSVNGITINEACLTNGQCKFNIYDTLGIRTSVRNEGDATSVGLFVQDIVLSATFFIGTVVTVALIVSGLMYIFAAASGKDPANAKKGITGAIIGLVIVACSYFIIRLVQYIAKGV